MEKGGIYWMELPLATLERLIKKAGAKRVSESAAIALGEILEEKAMEISREAIKLAEHAGRRTVRDIDIRLAAKRS
ncbi:MAG: NFYB/HAP3 family transcription factor subunit [Candidatus Hadarchaeales archaeon]